MTRQPSAIVLATDEATNNIMRHAHRGRPEAPIQIQCYFCSDGLEIHLLDEGEPFDINAVPHLDPSELRIGGRGVFLMRALMDELTCQPREDNGNRLRMVKALQANRQFRYSRLDLCRQPSGTPPEPLPQPPPRSGEGEHVPKCPFLLPLPASGRGLGKGSGGWVQGPPRLGGRFFSGQEVPIAPPFRSLPSWAAFP